MAAIKKSALLIFAAGMIWGVALLSSGADLSEDLKLSLGQGPKTLVISSVRPVQSDLTIPSDVCLSFENGGACAISNGVTLTINGPVKAPLTQIFRGSGKTVFGPGALEQAYSQWWGAAGDDSTDDAAAFQAAHDALPRAGGIIVLPPPRGKYVIASTVHFTKPIRVMGAGRATIIRAQGTAMTAVFEVNAGGDGCTFEHFKLEGGKNAAGGTVQRGIYINGAKDCFVQHILFSGPNSTTGFNFGVDINGESSGRSSVCNNRFERLVSSTGNGCAVLIEASSFNTIHGNVIDSTEFNKADGSAGAAIFLSAKIGGHGSTDNHIGYNRIHDHPQVGIAINSTTYAEFQGLLGACDRNVFESNHIYNCHALSGDEASSGIMLVGNSSFNRLLNNKIHNNGHATAGGFGIVLSSSQGFAKTITGAGNASPIVVTTSQEHGFSTGNKVGVSGVNGNTAANGTWTITNLTATTFSLNGSTGSGAYSNGGLVGMTGTAKIDETPNDNELIGNSVYHNKDDGIRIKGAINSIIRGNVCYENGQRTPNTFRNLYLTTVGGASTGNTTLVRNNEFIGAQPKYQIEIGSGVAGTILEGNHAASAGTGSIEDGGTGTMYGPNVTSK